MIFVTKAPNDAELMPHFPPGMAEFQPIAYGDTCFVGAPIDGIGTLACQERKKLGDMVSCIESGRHIEQVRRAYQAGWTRQTLILQLDQPIRKGTGGFLEVRRGKEWSPYTVTGKEFHYDKLMAYLQEIYWLAGVQVVTTRSTKESVEAIVYIYRALSIPPDSHHLLDKYYSAPIPKVSMLGVPSLIERVAKELPGVGWGRSKAIREKFGTVRAMVNGTDAEWLSVDGIGKGILDKIKGEPTW